MIKAYLLLACSLLLALAAAPAAADTGEEIQGSFKFYKKEVARGISLYERHAILDRIITKYRARRNNVQLLRVLTEKNYLCAWQDYRRMADAGADIPARLARLDTLRNAYRRTDVDLSLVETEYAALCACQAAPAPGPAVLASSVTAAAPIAARLPAAPATPVEPVWIPESAAPPARTAKYLAVGATGLGTLGLYGYDMIVNCTDRCSLAAGYGLDTTFAALPNARSTARRTTYQGVIRYGRNVYCGMGVQQRVTRGEAVAGAARTPGEFTSYGIPLILGVETGAKRGLFFSIELAFIPYFGGRSRDLTATDPASGAQVTVQLKTPQSGIYFGLGAGLYLF
jgi:hypothetical protein